MNILLAVASKHGATHEVGDAIAQVLTDRGLRVDVRNASAIADPADYDAVVLGSAVYMGHLMPAAHAFVADNRDSLAAMPVWLFSSGQLGAEHPVPSRPTGELDEVAELIDARGSRHFGGRLDNAELGIGERIVSRAVGAPEGDFRDWGAIRQWATAIAESMLDGQPAGATAVPAA